MVELIGRSLGFSDCGDHADDTKSQKSQNLSLRGDKMVMRMILKQECPVQNFKIIILR